MITIDDFLSVMGLFGIFIIIYYFFEFIRKERGGTKMMILSFLPGLVFFAAYALATYLIMLTVNYFFTFEEDQFIKSLSIGFCTAPIIVVPILYLLPKPKNPKL